ncbi:MAG: DNA polymerase IV [Crocinitomicaceae bacterium]|nr:DNA polymerase IV [Crocinitomicaceae bacterium]
MSAVTADRTILHVDMDAFFASVEQRDDPSLAGRPVLVGGRGGRGVVAAASYEARVFGCRSAMPMAEAQRRCPDAVVMPPSFERYESESRRIMDLIESVSPMVEPLSIDEAFVDVTGSRRLLGDGETIARLLRARIESKTGLTASIGVAPSKFVAKIASDLDKPDGLTVMDSDGLVEQLASLPIRRMWGIGPRTADRCAAAGIQTFGDLQRRSPEDLGDLLGNAAKRFHDLAHGRDDRPVVTDRIAKSIGHEQTFHQNIEDPSEVESVLLRHVERSAARLRRGGRMTRSVVVKVRDGSFATNTRSTTLDHPTDQTGMIWDAARSLFRSWPFRPVRLIGVSLARLDEEDTESLFGSGDDSASDRRRRLDAATDAIRDRFGGDSIGRTSASLSSRRTKERSEGADRPD